MWGFVLLLGLWVGLAAPSAAAEHSFRIINDAPTEINARIRLYSDDYMRISVGNEVTLDLPKTKSSVGVEIKTRKRWERCFVYAFPGAVIRVRQDHAKIVCRAR